MNLTTRLLLSFFVVVLMSAYVFYDDVSDQLELGISQSTEETMVDSANLLAELIEDEFIAGNLTGLRQASDDYVKRNPEARIRDIVKTSTSSRIYVTDDTGTVVFDSDNDALGEDYSQWNNIIRSLRGEYGARATRSEPGNDVTTVLHVSAPIITGANIIGVVTVAKSKLSLQPYVDRLGDTLLTEGIPLLIGALGICLLLAFWLTRSIRRLVTYADNVVGNTGPPPPAFSEPEFRQLSEAMQAMRHRLDGKEYVEQYIESLTHEIKSPVAAIKGAIELMDDDMPAADRTRFLDNIEHEISRLESITGRLMQLAELEHQTALVKTESVDLAAILTEQVAACSIRCEEKALHMVETYAPASVTGDSFLLKQAINNLLDNAINHAPTGSKISVTLTSEPRITIQDLGPGIPDYALTKVFDRFFSLPDPVSGKKSSGLGLSFVRQILTLHNAEISLSNTNPGVCAKIIFKHT